MNTISSEISKENGKIVLITLRKGFKKASKVYNFDFSAAFSHIFSSVIPDKTIEIKRLEKLLTRYLTSQTSQQVLNTFGSDGKSRQSKVELDNNKTDSTQGRPVNHAFTVDMSITSRSLYLLNRKWLLHENEITMLFNKVSSDKNKKLSLNRFAEVIELLCKNLKLLFINYKYPSDIFKAELLHKPYEDEAFPFVLIKLKNFVSENLHRFNQATSQKFNYTSIDEKINPTVRISVLT